MILWAYGKISCKKSCGKFWLCYQTVSDPASWYKSRIGFHQSKTKAQQDQGEINHLQSLTNQDNSQFQLISHGQICTKGPLQRWRRKSAEAQQSKAKALQDQVEINHLQSLTSQENSEFQLISHGQICTKGPLQRWWRKPAKQDALSS